MAIIDSSGSSFFINDVGSTERDITTFCKEATGFPGSHELVDVTAIGDAGSRFLPVRTNTQARISGVWDDVTTTGLDAILGPLRTHTSEIAFRYVIVTSFGTTTYSGSAWLNTFEITGRVGTAVEWSMTLRVHDVITRAFVRDTDRELEIVVTLMGEPTDTDEFFKDIKTSTKGEPDDTDSETFEILTSTKGEPDDIKEITAEIATSVLEVA